jgi:hypothetical protein
MFSFVAVQNPDGCPSDEWNARVARVAAQAFPWAKDLRSTKWASSSGTSRLWAWSNEPSSVTGGVEITQDSARAWLGCGGRGPSCLITSNRITCTTPIARLEPIYYAEQSGNLIVSSRALLIALLLTKTGRLDLDFAALSASFANSYASGSFTTNRTPFAGVHMALPNAKIVAQDRKLYVTDPGNIFSDFGFGVDEPDQHFYRELTNLFLERLEPHVVSVTDLRCPVTGGQDSRLLAAALKALGIKFTATTTGFDNNPDVIIGKKVAAFLGAPHEQVKPETLKSELGNLFAVDVRWAAAYDLLHSDGMLLFDAHSGVMTKRPISDSHFCPQPVLDTAGSEIWRGGYANRRFQWFDPNVSAREITASTIIGTMLTDIFCRNAHFLRPEWRRVQETYAAHWLSPCIERDRPIAAAEKYYLEFEFGRRTPAHNTRNSAASAGFYPFADPGIVERIARLETHFRRDDLLHYNVMKMLAPGVENLPFEMKRWGFEWNGPAKEADRAAWLARAPLIDLLSITAPYGQIYGVWPMRDAVGSDCWRRLSDELFCYEDEQNVWSFLDRNALLQAFTSEQIFTPQLSNLFWGIYGLSVLLSGDWLRAAEIPESIVYTRNDRPWPDIYKDLCAGVGEVEDSAREKLINGIANWLSRMGAEVAPDPVEPRVLLRLEGDPVRENRAWFAPGQGRRLQLSQEANQGSWRVTVEAEAASAPASSYLIFRLGQVASHADVAVSVRYRAKVPSEARCWFSRSTVAGRDDLVGPVLKYEREWQTFEYILSPVGRGLDKAGALELEFLLALPVQTNQVDIDALEINLRPPPDFAVFLRQIEQQLIGDLRSTIRAIRERNGLSEAETDDLMRRAGLYDTRLAPASDYELWRFENWLRETCPQNLAPNDLRKWLMAGRAHWRLLTLCFGLSEDIRRHLLDTAITAAGPLQSASMAM